jgi:membrane protease YdiL (CAAX protease family)
MSKRKESVKSHPSLGWIFFALTYALSWLFWIPTALSGRDPKTSAWVIPYMLGGFGPSVAAILLNRRATDQEGRRAFWNRVVSFTRISMRGYLFIFLIFPVLFGLSFLIDRALGYPMPDFPTLKAIRATPIALIGMVLLGIITGPLSEELGWRGFALDRLQDRHGPWIATLIIGLFWGLWHLPLFFIRGTTQYRWGFGSVRFWLFLTASFPLSAIFTSVYNRNNRSILSAVLLHFTYNFTLNLVYPFPARILIYETVLLFITAIALTLGQNNPKSVTPNHDDE